jgi:hypothetical protein
MRKGKKFKFFATRKITRQVIREDGRKQGHKASKWLNYTWDNAQCRLVGIDLRARRQAKSTRKHGVELTKDRREIINET